MFNKVLKLQFSKDLLIGVSCSKSVEKANKLAILSDIKKSAGIFEFFLCILDVRTPS